VIDHHADSDAVDTFDELEAQRVFLMRSLDDLEDEWGAGNIDEATYARLHGDYTARAAAVLRALGGEPVASVPAAPPVSGGRRALVIGGLIAFAIAAAVVLAVTIGPRQPGGTVTGGLPSGPKANSVLKAAVASHPKDYSARIEYARALLPTDSVAALDQYNAAAKLSPSDPEPPTYIGWILGLASSQVTDAAQHTQLVTQALNEFARARRLDPRYADSYVFEGLVRFEFANQPAAAVPLLTEYLRLAPDGQLASLVKTSLKKAQTAAKGPTATTTAAATPTTSG
jgi:tetratricopeptide (TPR) repeat protein